MSEIYGLCTETERRIFSQFQRLCNSDATATQDNKIVRAFNSI